MNPQSTKTKVLQMAQKMKPTLSVTPKVKSTLLVTPKIKPSLQVTPKVQVPTNYDPYNARNYA